MMKLHKILANAVVATVKQIFFDGRYADKAIEQVLKSNPKWGARDRAFIAETTYDMVRWWRLLWHINEEEPQNNLGSLWQLLGTMLVLKNIELPDWPEFKNINPRYIQKKREQIKQRSILQSIPEWLDETGSSELKENWETEMVALNKPAPLVIRTNTLKTDKKKLWKVFADKEITVEEASGLDDALVFKRRMNLFAMPEFKNGWFEVQDASSQQVGAFLNPEPGMRVIDACAGAGGKTLHLAALMQNKGRIIAMDTEAWKLEELKKRARRAGADNIETRVIDDAKTIKRLHETADRLLLDVPCSGLGVLRRNPDAKWKLQPHFLEKIRFTQQEIIQHYSTMLKPGGLMVYATCSILPSENTQQVQHFLEHNTQYTLLEERPVSATSGFDGFYMALIKKAT